MNNITKRNRITEQLDRYSKYVPYCDEDSKNKLLQEMLHLGYQVARIKQMGLDELQKQVEEYIDVRESKMNFTEVHLLETEQKNYGKRTA